MPFSFAQFWRYFPLTGLVLVALILWLSGAYDYFSLQSIQILKDILAEKRNEWTFLFDGGFVAFYALTTAFFLPTATPLTLLAGFLFGPLLGTLYVVTGATSGAVALFFAAQGALGAPLRKLVGPVYKRIQKDMEENAAGYLLFLRLVPVFPFMLVNIASALAGVGFFTFFWTTAFGIIPGTFVYVNLGVALAEIESYAGLLSTQTLVAFALLGIFALIPTVYKKWRAGRKAKAV